MNLEQAIVDLEEKAAQYTQAAQSIRALLNSDGTSQPAAGRQASARSAKQGGSKGNAKSGANKQSNFSNIKSSKKSGTKKSPGKRPPMSAETRAKLSQAMKARHQQKAASGN